MSLRAVRSHVQSTPTLEGAGVHLRRAFGFGETEHVDPFLLLDDFRNDVPDDYLYQVTAEELVEKQRDGRKHWVWQMKQGRHHNHALDTTYYAVAATRVYGLANLGEPAREKLRALCQVDGPKPAPPEKAPPRPAPPRPKGGGEFGTDAPLPRMTDEWRG